MTNQLFKTTRIGLWQLPTAYKSDITIVCKWSNQPFKIMVRGRNSILSKKTNDVAAGLS